MTWTRATRTSPEFERCARNLAHLVMSSHMHSWLKALDLSLVSSPWSSMIAPLRVAFPLLLPLVLPCLLFFLPPPALRAVLWARQPDRHWNLLCHSANKGSNDAHDVSVSLTGYKPNFMAFSELNDSSGSFSYTIPSSDQDLDDVTLGKLLTEAHRGQANYCEPEGVSVSQSSSSVLFDGSGKLDGERNVDQSVGFVFRVESSHQTKDLETAFHEIYPPFSSRPDCNNTSDVPFFTLRTAL